MMASEPIVIVGGGPSGAAAACLLGLAGRRPLLLERETAPRDKVCGDFLSWEAQLRLSRLGLDAKALGGAPIRTVRLVHGRTSAEARLPFEGVGLTRRALDEALLARARDTGARIERGVVVRGVATDGAQLIIAARDRDALQADAVFLATGKHDLPDWPRPPAGPAEDFIGFKTYLTLAPGQRRALAGAVEIVLFDGGYAGLQSVETGMASFCLLVRRAVFAEAGGNWTGLEGHLRRSSPHLGMRLAASETLLPKPLSIFQVPYGFLHDPASGPDGLFRLGDQMAVIPSFTGDGVAIALHSGARAAGAYMAGAGDKAFHAAMRTDVAAQVRLAAGLSLLGRTGFGRMAAVWACRAWPGALGTLASLTRIPARAVEAATLGGPVP